MACVGHVIRLSWRVDGSAVGKLPGAGPTVITRVNSHSCAEGQCACRVTGWPRRRRSDLRAKRCAVFPSPPREEEGLHFTLISDMMPRIVSISMQCGLLVSPRGP